MNQVHRWRAFAVLAVSFFMTVADLAIVNVALPTIGRKLHMAESSLQWVVTGYALTFGGFLLLGGRAADLLGRRRILMAGLFVFTAASLGCGLATADSVPDRDALPAGARRGDRAPGGAVDRDEHVPRGRRAEQGAGRVGRHRGERRGRRRDGRRAAHPLRWAGSTSSSSTSRSARRRWLLAPRVVPESRLATARRRYDPFGAVTVTGGLSLLVYAISTAPQVGWGTARTVSLLAVSAALLAAFVVIETRVEAPLMPLRIFRSKTLAGANAVGLLLGGSFFAFIFIGTLYMQQVLGYSALKAGLAWLVMALSSVAFAGLSQALVTRGSARLVMAAGMAMIGGGILWATQVPVHGHFWADLAGPFFIVGVGTAFAFVPVSIAALAGVAEHEAGLASGLINTSQQLGGAIGVAVASTIAATHASTLLHQGTAPAAALTGGFHWAFWACGANRPGRSAGDLPARPPQRTSHSGCQHIPEAAARTCRCLTESPPHTHQGSPHANARTSDAAVTGASRGFGRASPPRCRSTARCRRPRPRRGRLAELQQSSAETSRRSREMRPTR